MRLFLQVLIFLAVALSVAFGLTYYAVHDGRLLGAYNFGAWTTWPNAGAPDPDPYSHAYVVRSDKLQMGRGEGISFIAETDDAGEPLSRECNYLISGATPVASFWTLTATDFDGVNIARPEAETSFSSQRISRDNQGIAHISVGPSLASGNWLEITGSGPFQLHLNFYDASFFAGLGTTVSTLPKISRGACK